MALRLAPDQLAALRRATQRTQEYLHERVAADALDLVRLYQHHRNEFIIRLQRIYDTYLGAEPSLLRARGTGAWPELAGLTEDLARQLADDLAVTSVENLRRMVSTQRSRIGRALGDIFGDSIAFRDLPVSTQDVLADVTTTITGGGTYFDRLLSMSEDLRQDLLSNIRTGLVNADDFDTVRERMLKSFGVDRLAAPKYNAYGTVKWYQNEARRAWNDVMADVADDLGEDQAMEVWWAQLDERTTPGCLARHGRPIRALRGERPPRHLNCRCTIAVVPAGAPLDDYRMDADDWLHQKGYTRRRAAAMEAESFLVIEPSLLRVSMPVRPFPLLSGRFLEAWDPAKHPKHPAGAPEGKGGQFAPKGGVLSPGAPEPEAPEEAPEPEPSATGDPAEPLTRPGFVTLRIGDKPLWQMPGRITAETGLTKGDVVWFTTGGGDKTYGVVYDTPSPFGVRTGRSAPGGVWLENDVPFDQMTAMANRDVDPVHARPLKLGDSLYVSAGPSSELRRAALIGLTDTDATVVFDTGSYNLYAGFAPGSPKFSDATKHTIPLDQIVGRPAWRFMSLVAASVLQEPGRDLVRLPSGQQVPAFERTEIEGRSALLFRGEAGAFSERSGIKEDDYVRLAGGRGDLRVRMPLYEEGTDKKIGVIVAVDEKQSALLDVPWNEIEAHFMTDRAVDRDQVFWSSDTYAAALGTDGVPKIGVSDLIYYKSPVLGDGRVAGTVVDVDADAFGVRVLREGPPTGTPPSLHDYRVVPWENILAAVTGRGASGGRPLYETALQTQVDDRRELRDFSAYRPRAGEVPLIRVAQGLGWGDVIGPQSGLGNRLTGSAVAGGLLPAEQQRLQGDRVTYTTPTGVLQTGRILYPAEFEAEPGQVRIIPDTRVEGRLLPGRDDDATWVPYEHVASVQLSPRNLAGTSLTTAYAPETFKPVLSETEGPLIWYRADGELRWGVLARADADTVTIAYDSGDGTAYKTGAPDLDPSRLDTVPYAQIVAHAKAKGFVPEWAFEQEEEPLAEESPNVVDAPPDPEWFTALSAKDRTVQRKLMRESHEAVPRIAALAERLTGQAAPPEAEPDEDEEEEPTPSVPESWDDLNDIMQEDVEAHFIKEQHDDALQSEKTSYIEGGQALLQVYDEFDPNTDEWLEKSLTALLSGVPEDDPLYEASLKHAGFDWDDWTSDDPDEPRRGFKEFVGVDRPAIAEFVASLTLTPRGKLTPPYNKQQLEIAATDDALAKLGAALADPRQPVLPGMSEEEYRRGLGAVAWDAVRSSVTAMVDQIVLKELEKRVDDLSEQVDDSMFEDSAKETVEMLWGDKTKKEKFQYAKDYASSIGGPVADAFEEPEVERPEGEAGPLVMPKQFKTMKDGDDYARTRRLGRALVVERAAELLASRAPEGDPKGDVETARATMRTLERDLWSNWKSDSASAVGVEFQKAVGKELGAEVYTAHAPERFGRQRVRPEMLAYVRGLWETTQYLLTKGNRAFVTLHRAIMRTPTEIGRYAQDENGKIRDFKLRRNGAASFTGVASVANSWQGAGVSPSGAERIVLRVRVPREAVLALPVYGKNIHEEQEVVVAGTPWQAWDAHVGRAPERFHDLPPVVPEKEKVTASEAAPPRRFLVVDLFLEDARARRHWLAKDRSGKAQEAFDPAKHVRHPKGSPRGGQFAPKGQADAPSAPTPARAPEPEPEPPKEPTPEPTGPSPSQRRFEMLQERYATPPADFAELKRRIAEVSASPEEQAGLYNVFSGVEAGVPGALPVLIQLGQQIDDEIARRARSPELEERLAQATAVRDAVWKELEERMVRLSDLRARPEWHPQEPEYVRLLRERDALNQRYWAVRQEKRDAELALNKRESEAALEVLSAMRPFGPAREIAFASTSDRDRAEDVMQVAKYFPREWWDAVQPAGEAGIQLAISRKAGARGQYFWSEPEPAGGGAVDVTRRASVARFSLPERESASTALHELGHMFDELSEGVSPVRSARSTSDIGFVAKAFWERRTAGEQYQSLGPPYHPTEMTKVDRFGNPYVGKPAGEEIFTMGLEALFSREWPNIRNDREHMAVVLMLLAAGGRNPRWRRPAQAAEAWDPAKHVRHPKGSERGGQFAPKGGVDAPGATAEPEPAEPEPSEPGAGGWKEPIPKRATLFRRIKGQNDREPAASFDEVKQRIAEVTQPGTDKDIFAGMDSPSLKVRAAALDVALQLGRGLHDEVDRRVEANGFVAMHARRLAKDREKYIQADRTYRDLQNERYKWDNDLGRRWDQPSTRGVPPPPELSDEALETARQAVGRAHSQLQFSAWTFSDSYQKIVLSVLEEFRPFGPERPIAFTAESDPQRIPIVKNAARVYPRDWWDAVQPAEGPAIALDVQMDESGRGRYYRGVGQDKKNAKLTISGQAGFVEGRTTAIHELGHMFDELSEGVPPPGPRHMPGLGWRNANDVFLATRAFYDERTRGEASQALGGGYRPDEMTRVDRFGDPYVGKVDGEEVFTMGVESLFSERGAHTAQIRQDRDHMALILLLLATAGRPDRRKRSWVAPKPEEA